MIKESILNSFISSNMQLLGLHHVNSEVPKVVSEHIGKRTDILGFDLATCIPMVLELKVKRDPQVVGQLQEYINLISTKYPNLFEELNAFRKLEDFRFNYCKGIVGMVISPELPPNSIQDCRSTILWSQFSKSHLDNDGVFRIVAQKLLSSASSVPLQLKDRPTLNRLRPTQFVASSCPYLRKFVERLDEIYLSVSPTIYPRYKLEYNYIAYYGTDTERNGAVFGFGTGTDRAQFDVTFHIKEKHHRNLLSHPAITKLGALGLHVGHPRKDLIFPVRIEEIVASKEKIISEALALFKELAGFAYNCSRVPELQKLRIDSESSNALAVSKFL